MREKEAAEWQARHNFACVVHQGRIFVVGGRTHNGLVNDVWSSSLANSFDSVIFEQRKGVETTANQVLSTRERALALSFKGNLYLFGGCRDGSGGECVMALKEVLYSREGETWTRGMLQSGSPAQLPDFFVDKPYQLMGSVHDDAMLVLGANTVAVVRVMDTEAISIEQVYSSSQAGWQLGRAGVALSIASLVFTLGGETNGGGRSNRVTFSPDGGRSWTDIPAPPLLFPPRTDLGGAVLNGRLCVFGGLAGSVALADV
eukprot:3418791-Rhodomonas_salina.1